MLLSTIAATVGNLLISNGVKVLGNTIKNATEDGLEKVNDLVKENTGIELFDTERELTDEQYLELKKLESNHATELCNLMVEYAKVAAADTANAREAYTKALATYPGWFQTNFIYVFAFFWSIFATVYILLITVTNIPAENQRFADTILGFVLGTVIASMLQFFYGSSLKIPDNTSTTKKEE